MFYKPLRIYASFSLVCFLFLLMAPFENAFAQGVAEELQIELSPQEELLFKSTANELRCPTCVSLSVMGSDAPFSIQIKNMVKQQIKEGKNQEAILGYFQDRYGPWILRSPPQEGFHLMVWVIPLLILLMGPPLIWFFVWRKKREIPAYGVRAADVIIKEMHAKIAEEKNKISLSHSGESLC